LRETFFQWITQYGAVGLFFALVLGILGLPVPDELLLTYTGYLAFRGHVPLWSAMVAAFAGSVCGISLSYALGRVLGSHKLERYAAKIGVTEEKLAQAHAWFRRWGKWTLVLGYFVPGIRHLTALIAGASRLELHLFATFAWAGALIWSQTFIVMGYSLGNGWKQASHHIHRLSVVVTGAIVVALVIFAVVRWSRRKRSVRSSGGL
jgi:membrane protein DedA with SNARE-associated domain